MVMARGDLVRQLEVHLVAGRDGVGLEVLDVDGGNAVDAGAEGIEGFELLQDELYGPCLDARAAHEVDAVAEGEQSGNRGGAWYDPQLRGGAERLTAPGDLHGHKSRAHAVGQAKVHLRHSVML